MDTNDMQPEDVPDSADDLLQRWNLPSGDVIHMIMKDDSRPTTITGPAMEWGPDDDYDEPHLVWSGKRGWRWFAWRYLHRR